jgi:integrase
MIYKRGCDKKGPDGTCSKCAARGSCGVYWYKFMWQGKLVRESTKQRNDKVARNMESAHRTSLAKGEVGLRDKKLAPTVKEFITGRVDPWAKATFEKNSPETYIRWFRPGFRAICAYLPLASTHLDEVTGEHFAGFAAHRQTQKLAVSTVNSNLRVLRRVLSLAVDWGVLAAIPKMKLLRGERIRDRVVSQEEERKYLAAAPEPLASIVTVLFDSGLRTDECFRLRWERISWMNGKYGTLAVMHGKSSAARRVLPMTARVRAVLEYRWLAAQKPEVGYVWPSEKTSTGYVHDETIRRAHLETLQTAKVRHFVLHSVRHSFLTRLGESGCDTWTLARIAGHSSIKVSSRYVHPSSDAMQAAMSRLGGEESGGHKSGHKPIKQLPTGDEKSTAVSVL